jgi:hypothetical protein
MLINKTCWIPLMSPLLRGDPAEYTLGTSDIVATNAKAAIVHETFNLNREFFQ